MILYNRWRASSFSALSLLAALVALPAQGQIVYTGDFNPTDPVSLDINPDPNILDIDFTNFTVGQFGASTLYISNGWSLLNHHAYVGRQDFSSGEATIDGIGSSWINSGAINLGSAAGGTGVLNLINGGLLQAQALTINPTRGTLNWDNGTIRIANGSADSLHSGGNLFLGNLAGQTQKLELVGVNSVLNISSNRLYIGNSGHGTLLIDRGTVTSYESTIGSLAGSTGIATITGGNWSNSKSIDVGFNGTGTLNIAGGTVEAYSINTYATNGTLNWTDGTIRINGGTPTGLTDANNDLILGHASGAEQHLELLNGSTFNSNNSVIGNALGANSSVTVQGTGSMWTNAGNIDVGLDGTGVLNIDGGTVEAYSINTHVTNGTVNWTAGTVRINGGRATGLTNASDNLNLGQSGNVQHLELLNGVTFSSNNSEIGYDSSVTLQGSESRWFNAGDINIGQNGPGELNINGGTIEAQSINTYSGDVNWTAGTIRLFGGTATGLTDGSNNLILGQISGDQHLELLDGTTFSSNNSRISSLSGSNSSVTVQGSGSIWSNTGKIDVGLDGPGLLTIEGGTVEAQNINTHAAGSVNWTSGTVRIEGGTATGLTDVSDDLILDNHHHLELLNGATFSNNNSAIDTNSSVLVRDSTWTNAGDINVGLNSTGELNIDSGTVDAHSINTHATQGTVNWTGGTIRINGGTASGLGGASDAIILGQNPGTSQHLKLLNGGSMSSTSDSSFLGFVEDATGTFTIDGTDSSWINSGDVFVGDEGTGILNIQNGGEFEARSLYRHPTNGTLNWTDGTVRIHGGSATSLLGANNWFHLGTVAEKSQYLELHSGAYLNAARSYIGDVATASGSVLIDGPGSSLHNASNVYIGFFGQGDVNISNGGSMISGLDVNIGHHVGASGEVTVDGPDSVFSARILNAGYSGAGTLNILNGGTVEAVSFRVFDTFNWVDGTLRMKGSSVTGITPGNTLTLGATGIAQHLELTLGTGLSVANANIGSRLGKVGSLTVDGAGSLFNSTQATTLGGAGTGDLIVSNGGLALAAEANLESNGTATITGPGSTWTISTVFDMDNGTMNIAQGGVVNSHIGLANLGYLQGSDGHVTVDGPGSAWNNDRGHLRVGILGQGSLEITNGGSVNNTQGYIGYFAPLSGSPGSGSVTVDGLNSSWVNRHNLVVGRKGIGELSVSNGGSVSSLNGIIASEIDGRGTVTIRDAGSSWHNTGELTVGNQFSGTLNISNGGLVTNTNAYIGRLEFSNGEVTISGTDASWINSGVVYVGNDGNDGNGILNVYTGGTLEAQSLNIHATNGTLNWAGGTIRINGGTASDLLDVDNNLLLYNGRLELINGTSITTTSGYIGQSSGSSHARSSVLVAGSGSMWINTGDLLLGVSFPHTDAQGSLIVANGGQVENRDATISYDATSTGSVTVDGPDTIWNNTGTLVVSRKGQGTLNITNGGHVIVAGDLSMSLLGGTSALNFTLASLADPLLDVAGHATLNGTLSVDLDAGLILVGGDTFTLIDIGLTQSGVFTNYAQDDLLGTFNGVDLFLSYLGGDGNDVVAYAVIADVMFSNGFEGPQ